VNASFQRDESDRSREHVLLTILGINPRSAVYGLGDVHREANLSTLALLELLEQTDRPSRVLAICTSEAREQTWEILQRGLARDIHADPVEVPNTGSPHELADLLSAVADKIPDNVDLTVDITHGFRHYSFLTYAAVLYLASLRDIRVRGVYYGMLQDAPAISPLIDLSPLLELQELIYAVRTLRDTGSAIPLATALGGEANAGHDGDLAAGLSDPSGLASDLMRLSEAHASGLPLEFGNLVHSLLSGAERKRARQQRREEVKQTVQQHGSGKGTVAKSFGDLFYVDLSAPPQSSSDDATTPPEETPGSLSAAISPLVEELLTQFRDTLEPFELRAGAYWKDRVSLGAGELKRQARVIDYQLRCRNTSTAIGMMEEWAISWAAWCRGDYGEWLIYSSSRRRARAVLASFGSATCGQRVCAGKCPSTEICRLGKFWSDLTELRNSTHHHGMTPADIIGSAERREALAAVLEYWDGTLKMCPSYGDLLKPVLATDKRVLVSPLGMTPGVLLTALETCRRDDRMGEPTLCIIVCSNETESVVNDALLEHGKYEGEIQTLIFQDPQAGISELGQITGPAHQLLEDATEVVVNITGGTTLMGVAVEKIASEAPKIASNSPNSRISVRRIGLIDRRPPEEQRSNPYVVGDAIWIDGREG